LWQLRLSPNGFFWQREQLDGERQNQNRLAQLTFFCHVMSKIVFRTGSDSWKDYAREATLLRLSD